MAKIMGLVGIILGVLILSACASTPPATPVVVARAAETTATANATATANPPTSTPTTAPSATATAVPPTATVTPTLAPTNTAVPPTATAIPPTATSVPPTAAPRSPTAIPPTAVPSPTAKPQAALRIEFTGQFQPNLLRVGNKLVVALTTKNLGGDTIHIDRIFTTGPWDKYTVVNVMPGKNFSCDFLGCNAWLGSLAVAPGKSITVNIIAYPNEPGSHQFSFIPHLTEGEDVRDASGDKIVIGGKVAVTR